MTCGHTVPVPLQRYWPSETTPRRPTDESQPLPEATDEAHPIHNVKFYKLCRACEAVRDSRLEKIDSDMVNRMVSDSGSTKSRRSTVRGGLKEMMLPELPQGARAPSSPGTPRLIFAKGEPAVADEEDEEERKADFWKTGGN